MTRLPQIELPADVLRSAQAGSPEAQATIYRAFSGSVYGLIRRLVPRAAAADDLLQDTFVEVLQSLRRFRGEAPLGVWIRRIAVSKCLMYLRSPWNRRLLWLDGQAEDAAPASTLDVLMDAGDPHAPASRVGAQIDIESALRRLSPQARAVLWLHDVEGYTHVEIAALYGKTPSFSKSQLMRAHLRLRELLDTGQEEAQCTPVSTNS